MSLRNLPLKKAYSSDFDDVLQDFYIPALTEATEYKRLAGFFSSSSLATAARGILGLIRNDGVMKLVASPKLKREDLDILMECHKDPEKFMEEKMLDALERLENEFIRDHVRALGWMAATKRLEIRVAILHDEHGNPLSYEEGQQRGTFHQKVGILKDSQGNALSFSGSINETASGWLENIEEFKVFRGWEPFEKEYIEADISKFNMFWNNQSKKVKVVKIPQAVEKKLIEIAPEDIEKIDMGKWYRKSKGETTNIMLFQHQKGAVESWVKNKMKGIFEMATGTGKTFAALGCLEKASKTCGRLVVIITCPYQHLIQQWRRDIGKFGISFDQLFADSSNPSWKNNLADALVDISLGYKENLIILTTHRTFSSNNFRSILERNKNEFNILLIGDEVHGLGAKESRKGLTNEYGLRLGLSATPRRWFDFAGTKAIYDYFGDIVFEFGLEEAINTINPATGRTYLTPYRYIPKFVSLSAQELDEYIEKTKSIVRRFNKAKSHDEKDEILEGLLFRRADIIKNAVEKYRVLEEILDETGSNIKWAIVYCTPQQIDKVMEILSKRGIVIHRFTMDEGIKPEKKYDGLSERDFIIKKFAEGKYQALVAMKCLDEGVDVPPARTAILMASSGNPREYVQRIGRVVRRYPGKAEAIIYDLIVIPNFTYIPKELRDMERRIFEKELRRYEEIARIAVNNAGALKMVYDLKDRL